MKYNLVLVSVFESDTGKISPPGKWKKEKNLRQHHRRQSVTAAEMTDLLWL